MQYCIGTWNVGYMNQGKLEVVKQKMTRVNINIVGISQLRWTGMGEFNSGDHYIYIYNIYIIYIYIHCGQESLKKMGQPS